MGQQTIIKLVDGNLMPQLGIGVWQASNEQVVKAIDTALNVGYRSIDTAAIYHNETGVGKALRESCIPREEVFITTKLWNDRHQDAKTALQESLDRLQLEYIDLFLIHWPVPQQDKYVETWKQFIELKESGLVRSIGVCNFHIEHLQKLFSETGIVPAINQIELHPLMQQRQLHSWNATHHIITESWSPLSRGGKGVFDHPLVESLAIKYDKTPAQIVIRWHLDSGMIAIPKSVTPSRIKENFDVFDFRLEKEDLTIMAGLDIGKRLGPNPDTYNLTVLNLG
ncbi:2,5-didehydrogluconate reductase A [Xenorhabdus stockiae]|uniref:2,5-didehydrogluconate reductase A n=1 Tax=Xenorhabdus stockiae TaxID=351614 RepID=A0A2D0KSF5_9GAMM|nr:MULTISPECIES: 2,5-didehydrogluconate reductase DkgA [Xenorhabdus]PHM66298.1 2,5-didehydrogluconate reductase A [Xenorhabdus stockiae]PHM71975.1 2,5-didehydrogluconate reductase A [Xenorhabdus sp. KJ12.1]